MIGTADTTTDPYDYLEQLKQANRTWAQCLCEFIDNALDAGARNVTIARDGRWLEVSDDGAGIVDMQKALEWGKRGSSGKGTPGKASKFGIGLKHSAVWLGKKLKIDSRSETKESICRINWEMTPPGTPVEFETFANNGGRTGTTLRVELWDGRVMPQVDKQLGVLYMHAIRGGLSISVKRNGKATKVQPPTLPRFAEQLEDTIVAWGRRVHLVAGVMEQDVSSAVSGLMVCGYDKTILQSVNGFGAGDTSRFLAIATIDVAEWPVSTTKDDITDAGALDALTDAVESRCADLLQKAEQATRAIDVPFSTANKNLANMFSKGKDGGEEEKGLRDKRNKTKQGTQYETGRGGKHRNFERSEFRKANNSRGVSGRVAPIDGLKLAKAKFEAGSPMQKVDAKKGIVVLNEDHPATAALIRMGEKNPSILELRAIEAFVYEWANSAPADRAQLDMFEAGDRQRTHEGLLAHWLEVWAENREG